jgi:SAM-dependent methyltransferase
MVEKDRQLLLKIYDSAESFEQLPWYSPEPPLMLQKAIKQKKENGLALDIGCGAGINTSYLAKQGYDVTGVDFIDRALQYARERALKDGVQIELVKVNILKWECNNTFDLILDSGCLHGMRGEERLIYRKRLLNWLASDGDYVLIHFEKRHIFDWRPMGPRRITRRKIVNFFTPELVELDFTREKKRESLPIGPVVGIGSYWFRRAGKS